MKLTEKGRREVVASLREARTLILRRRDEAVKRLSEAEVEANQLGRMLSAADQVIEEWERPETVGAAHG